MLKNTASKLIVFAFDSPTNLPKTGDAANLTAYRSLDFGTVTVLADTSATEMDSTNAKGYYLFDLAQGETNGDINLYTAKSSTSGIVCICVPAAVHTIPATGLLAPATAGRTLVVDASGLADANAVKVGPTGSGTAQTARDLGASVLLSSGTGTGQLDFTSGVVKANATQWLGGTIPAVNVTGVPLVDAKYLLGTVFSTPTVAGIPNVNAKTWNDLATVALPLVPTTAGRTLDVSTGGEAGVDWANVGSPTTSLALTGTTVATTQKVDVETIKTQTLTCAAGVTVSPFVGSTGAAVNGTNANTLSSHDPGAPLGTSTLTQTQVTGGAYALNNASFAFNAALALTTQQKADVTAAVPTAAAVAAAVEAAILNEGDATALLAAIAAKVEDFILNEGDSRATLAAIAAAVWANVTRTLTAGTNIVLAKGVGVTGFNDLSAAQVNAEADTALADYDAPTNAEMLSAFSTLSTHGDSAWAVPAHFTNATFASDGVFATAALANAPTGGGTAPTAAQNAAAVWDLATSGHATAGTFGAAMSAAGNAGDPWSTPLPGSYAAGTAGYLVGANVPAIKAKTDLIGVAGVSVSAPVSADGVTLTVTAGYDYQTAEGRRLGWSSAQWPDLTGATVTLLTDRGDSFAGTLVSVGGATQSVGVALTHAQTAALRGPLTYQLRATHANGHLTDLVPKGTLGLTTL